MKLALYLPNFRDEVTVKELEDLTALAEDLDFDSVWTLDRIVVPEASDRQELQYSFGMIEGFPKALPVSARSLEEAGCMKLALYLPNFRDKVTVKELEDLTALAEALDFDSVWTLDRIVVPEASDRGELQYSFGMMDEFPKQLPVSSGGEWYQGWPLIPWLAAKTQKVRIGMSITDTPFRAPGVLAAELALDHWTP